MTDRTATGTPTDTWHVTAVAAGYAAASALAGALVTVAALAAVAIAGGLAGDNGVADSETSDAVLAVVGLAAFFVPAYLLGRFARRDLEVWCFGLGAFLAILGLGIAEAITIGDSGIGEIVAVAATVALGALVGNFAGYSMASYGEGGRRGRRPYRRRPFERDDLTGPHATIEQALDRVGRSGGRTVIGDLDHWGKPDPPLPTEVLVFSEAGHLCGRVTARADQRDELQRLGWHPDSPGRPPRDPAAPMYFERIWDLGDVAPAEIAIELRELLRLAGPIRHDALAPLEVELEDKRSEAIEPESAGYGSLVLGPVLVIVIAVVLFIVSLFVGEEAVDPFWLGIGVAMVAVLLVSSLGRWLIPRLPGIGRHADGVWWASLLLLPPLAAIGSYIAELVALG